MRACTLRVYVTRVYRLFYCLYTITTCQRMHAHFGNGSMARISSVSNYASGLSNTDGESCFKKLTLLNGIRLPDPDAILSESYKT